MSDGSVGSDGNPEDAAAGPGPDSVAPPDKLQAAVLAGQSAAAELRELRERALHAALRASARSTTSASLNGRDSRPTI